MATITTTYRRSRKEWEADPGEWSDHYITGPTRREAIANAMTARRERAASLRATRRRRREILDGFRAWLGGDVRYAPYVLLAWRHFTGYGNPRRCYALAAWKEAVVDQMRYEAWRHRWPNGWGIDPKCANGRDVWYAETPCGQISFHCEGMPAVSVPGDRNAQYMAEIDAEIWLDMNRGTPFCNVTHRQMRREAQWMGAQKRKCLAPHSRPWDGQRNVVAERIAAFYGVEIPSADVTFSDWAWALKRCGADITTLTSCDIYDERGW